MANIEAARLNLEVKKKELAQVEATYSERLSELQGNNPNNPIYIHSYNNPNNPPDNATDGNPLKYLLT